MTEGLNRGAIALVGAGEFLPTMAEVDRWLLTLAVLGGQHVPRVAIVPTAAAADGPETFARWGEMGTTHFRTLGTEAMVAQIQTPADARDPARVAALADQDLYYFSGGVPELLIEIFRHSPAWDTILAAHARGAVLAGCSAGAMAFGPATIAVREMVRGGVPGWIPALELIPRLCTLPHFDRMHEFVDDRTFAALLAAAPPGALAVGVDEHVALVGGPRDWQVAGRSDGSVTVLAAAGQSVRYPVGTLLRLEDDLRPVGEAAWPRP